MPHPFRSVPIALLFVLGLAAPADASVRWCRSDPVVSVDGITLNILVDIPAAAEELVTGPIRVRMRVPASVDARLIATDAGFNEFGEDVSIGDGGTARDADSFAVQVRVSVPIDRPGPRPLRVTVVPERGAEVVATGDTDGLAFVLYLDAGSVTGASVVDGSISVVAGPGAAQAGEPVRPDAEGEAGS